MMYLKFVLSIEIRIVVFVIGGVIISYYDPLFLHIKLTLIVSM